jgi:hypothetical protein
MTEDPVARRALVQRFGEIRLPPHLLAIGAAVRRGIEHLWAARRERPARLASPTIEDTAGVAAMLETITTAVGRDGITPLEAAALSGIADACRRALVALEFDRRLKALEADADAAKA